MTTMVSFHLPKTWSMQSKSCLRNLLSKSQARHRLGTDLHRKLTTYIIWHLPRKIGENKGLIQLASAPQN